jgi:ubiquinone/menaquinone biosynthesis C-methylase UbiE
VTHTNDHPGIWRRLVDHGFRLLYQELAWSYDLVAWLVSKGYWQTWGKTALEHLRGTRVLELGHGPGHLLVALKEHGFRPIGLDVSQQMGRSAQGRLIASGHAPKLAQGRAQNLPFLEQAFDSIVATFPTAYILDPMTLDEIARVLRPDGRLVVVLGARLAGQDPLSRLIEWLYRITGQREAVEVNAMRVAFSAAGLDVRQIQVDLKHSQVWLLLAEPIIPCETP